MPDPQQRAIAALGRELPWFLSAIGEDFRADPHAVLKLLAVAASLDRTLGNEAPFRAAHDAVSQWADVHDLGNRVGELINNPKIQRLAADRGIDWYLAHPSAAYEALRDGQASGAIDGDLALRGMETALAGQDFMAAEGAPEQAATYDSLIKASVTRRLTAAEQNTLDRLVMAKVGREMEAPEAPTAAPTAPGEYDQLIAKSVNGGLTADETARLTGLATARAESAGLLDPADSEPPPEEF